MNRMNQIPGIVSHSVIDANWIYIQVLDDRRNVSGDHQMIAWLKFQPVDEVQLLCALRNDDVKKLSRRFAPSTKNEIKLLFRARGEDIWIDCE